jgi:DNA-binding CsgD family transcriptional regulator
MTTCDDPAPRSPTRPDAEALVAVFMLTSLDHCAPVLAPTFCALLRDAIGADWVQVQARGNGRRLWRFTSLGADGARRRLLVDALDDLAAEADGPFVRELPPGLASRAGTRVLGAASACGHLHVQCVGSWSDAARLDVALASVAAAATALCGRNLGTPPGDGPALELDEGLLLVTADGTPRAWTPRAGAWLGVLRDALPEAPAASPPEAREQALHLRLRAMVTRSPDSWRSGVDGPLASARFDTPFGALRLQGLALAGVAELAALPVRLVRETPLPVALVEGVANTPLSPRQKQVAWLAASGLSYPAISRHLALARATVIDYMQGVYAKLAVASHEQLAVHLASRARA